MSFLSLPIRADGPDGTPAPALRSLDIEDVKVQWFSHGEEELPAWINAHFDIGSLGQVTGKMTETELSADANDEDGDPAGFETTVFDTADGSLRSVIVGRNGFTFTVNYPGKDGSQVVYVGRRSGDAPNAWVISAASRGPKGDSSGHNRFPLDSEEKEAGALEIFTQVDAPAGQDAQSL